MQDHINRPTLA